MNLVVDTHTHSIASGHAYSTVQEMAREAEINGIKAFALTDHGPALLGAPSILHFGNLRVIPKEIQGVRVIRGVEANIVDYSGATDMPEVLLMRLELVLASFHDICIKPMKVKDHTEALIKLIQNPCIDAVAHPGNPQFPIDIEKVVKEARKYDKLLEINNASFIVRKGSEENCREFVKECKRQQVRMICGSDAHISFDVGKFDKIRALLDEVEMPEELVLNSSLERMETYLKERAERIRKYKV